MIKDCTHPNLGHTPICGTCEPPIEWTSHAKCREHDPDLWYADDSQVFLQKRAIRICNSCPVKGYCLEIGWTDKFGIYAGYTPAQRHEYRKLFKLPSKPREARKMLRILAYKAL